ncbi:3-phosphoshikimate 1-carboxyvinyltransferase [Alicyclobacillus sendaiensis]|uniref:3-phosphoshikimate 1-carboxyvinyltransferase n=1 Tax=Alicyclobacillus sendaiensis TaxID=192387 RepID=UPI0026F4330D|nr:3-phosphoshikimate 1-carboxyvinyltransferase [Alicyclobacillus sendaiensis]
MADARQGADLEARSPWALGGYRLARVGPASGPVDADVRVPGSKSVTNRALVIAAMAKGESVLSGILRSDDAYWCIEALRSLGVPVEVEGDVVRLAGCNGQFPQSEARVYTGAGGTTARFLTAALAAITGEYEISGSRRMNERPMGELFRALRALGADIEPLERPDTLPIRLKARGLAGGAVEMSGAQSSQFVSGVLIAAPYARAPVTVRIVDHIVQHAYVHITLDMMRAFGAQCAAADDLAVISVEPGGYRGRRYDIEADASTACYFFAAAAVTGGRVRVTNLARGTRQPDVHFVDVLAKMGCEVTSSDAGIEVRGPATLRGGFSISMKEMSDQTLTLAFLAPFADGPIEVTGVGHIRHHESDRIRVIVESLARVGVRAEEREDGVVVYPGAPRPARLPSYDDHRVAMALSVLALRADGIEIEDPGCVSKTCPTFFHHLREMGVPVDLVP